MAFEDMQLVKSVLVETRTQGTGTPRELPIVGGHLALNFANTVDDPEGPERHDHAGTYPELVAWSVRVGIMAPDAGAALLTAAQEHSRAGSAALKRAHLLRHILIEIFTEIAAINSGSSATTGGSPPGARWGELRAFVTDAMAHAELAWEGSTYQLTWADTRRLHAMLWPISLAASDLLTGPQLSRLKKCAGCPWLFLDQSKNLSRRWCAMNDCGTHEKIRRYVTRRAASRRS
jgi:predicted RNA-binding Zn ribbon-like protein